MNVQDRPQEPDGGFLSPVVTLFTWIQSFVVLRARALAARAKGQSFSADTSELPIELRDLVERCRRIPRAQAALTAYALDPKRRVTMKDGQVVKYENAYDDPELDPYPGIVALALGLALDLTPLPKAIEDFPQRAQEVFAQAMFLGYQVRQELEKNRARRLATTARPTGRKDKDRASAKAARRARRDNRK